MATIPSRQVLERMEYRELQKLSKDFGIRANSGTSTMIESLVQKAQTEVPPPPKSRIRSTSIRHSSQHSSSRVSSTKYSEDTRYTVEQTTAGPSTSATAPEQPSLIPSRKRKAKEQQMLGVGRPKALRSQVLKAATRSTSASHNRKLRNSRSIKQVEETIQEELDSQQNWPAPQNQDITSLPTTSSFNYPTAVSQELSNGSVDSTSTPISDYHKLLSDAIKPLHEQIAALKTEVLQLKNLESELNQLRHEIVPLKNLNAKVELLTVEVQHLRTNLNQVSQRSSDLPSMTQGQSQSNHAAYSGIPGPSKTTVVPALLGKRQRELDDTGTPVVDTNDTARDISSPTKKRLKVSHDAFNDKGKEVTEPGITDLEESNSDTIRPRVTSFIVYNDPNDDDHFLDSPPPTTLLPEFYTSRSNASSPSSPRPARSTSSAHASENQNPFHFAFLPAASSPGPSLFPPAFPYPEPPQSPTPTGTNLGGLGNTASERTDVFKSFGFPPPDRARRLPSGNTGDPDVFSHETSGPGKQMAPSSNEVGMGLGLVTTSGDGVGSSSERDPPASKRTMYGTELEGDNRFGDFGVEGVATGFWAGTHY